MSWVSHSLKKHLTGAEAESFEECVSRLRLREDGPPITPAQRIEQLEDDLARAVLLIHSLTEACIRKGVFTTEEIAAAAAQIDLFDGVADGKLDPAVVRPQPTSKPPVVRDPPG